VKPSSFARPGGYSGDLIAPHRAAPFLASLVACGLVARRAAMVQVSDQPTRGETAQAARQAVAALLKAGAPRRSWAATALSIAAPTLAAAEIELLITDVIACHLRAQRNAKPVPTGNKQ
jgi:hypothetical protein